MNTREFAKVRDVVCGMEFKPSKAVAVISYEGRDFHFCTEACRRQFEQYPAEYAARAAPRGDGQATARPEG